MDTEEFRKHAHAFADWMADYLANTEQYPVRAQVKPGEIAARIAKGPPSAPKSFLVPSRSSYAVAGSPASRHADVA